MSVCCIVINSYFHSLLKDEAEAEADAANSVVTDFELPEDDYKELMEQKLKGQRNSEPEPGENSDTDLHKEMQIESDTSSQDHKVVSSDGESSKESDSFKAVISARLSGKDMLKRGTKRIVTPVKDNVPPKKDGSKEVGKKEIPKKEEPVKGQIKEEDKKEAVRKARLDVKKEDKKDDLNKINKKEPTSKKPLEQTKREVEVKKSEQRKTVETPKNPRETMKQVKTDSIKRGEMKITRSETPKQKADLKKDSEKKKEVDKKSERKSPEKTPESARGGKLRARKETEVEKLEILSGKI